MEFNHGGFRVCKSSVVVERMECISQRSQTWNGKSLEKRRASLSSSVEKQQEPCPIKKSAPYWTIPPATDGSRSNSRNNTHQVMTNAEVSVRVNGSIVTKREKSLGESAPSVFGVVEFWKLENALKPRDFGAHVCDPTCIAWTRYSKKKKADQINRLKVPLTYGFTRNIRYSSVSKPSVTYEAPCGRVLTTERELSWFLKLTKSRMTKDLFNYDYKVICLADFPNQGYNLDDSPYADYSHRVDAEKVDNRAWRAVSMEKKTRATFGIAEVREIETKLRPKTFKDHQCRPSCIGWTKYDPKAKYRISHLGVPLHYGYRRIISNFSDSRRSVKYQAPCGRYLCNMEEVFEYLCFTKSDMAVELFSFDDRVNCLTESHIHNCHMYKQEEKDAREKKRRALLRIFGYPPANHTD